MSRRVRRPLPEVCDTGAERAGFYDDVEDARVEAEYRAEMDADYWDGAPDDDAPTSAPLAGPDPWAQEQAAKARAGADYISSLIDPMSGRIDNWSEQ